LNGGKSTAESREDQQHLSIPEENALVGWITRLTATGHPPRHPFIQELAREILSSHIRRNGEQSDSSLHPPEIGDSPGFAVKWHKYCVFVSLKGRPIITLFNRRLIFQIENNSWIAPNNSTVIGNVNAMSAHP
jgi:hypothetical protein